MNPWELFFPFRWLGMDRHGLRFAPLSTVESKKQRIGETSLC